MKSYGYAILLLSLSQAEACSRALYVSDNGTALVSRSMDWVENVPTTLWAFPPGLQRTGDKGPNPLTWTSKYSSVSAVGYDMNTDGINEKGLVANILYLAESKFEPEGAKPTLQISMWAQYVLDSFANVSEVVDAMNKQSFRIVAPVLPDGHPAALHLAVSDAVGDSAIFEFVDGKLVTHHNKDYKVMTNSPTFDQQIALNEYWKSIGGMVSLPGTFKAADRFVRLSYLVDALPKNLTTYHDMLAAQLGIIRAVSVPWGFAVPGSPNLSQTLWRTLSDSSNKVYYFDMADRPSVFWVVLSDLNLTQGGKSKKLDTRTPGLAGNVASKFVDSDPLVFAGTPSDKSCGLGL